MLKKYVQSFIPNEDLPKDVIKIGNEWYIRPESVPFKNIRHPFIFGATLGFERGSRYVPSVYLIELLSKRAKHVVVNEKGAWLVICGRDVFKKSIVKTKGDPKDGDRVIIMNERNEAIGVGKMQKKGVMREYDIGDLLRREHKRLQKPRR